MAAAALVVLAACGSTITRIFMPDSVAAGQSFPVVVELDIDTKGSINPAGDSYGNFAIRLPKGWTLEPCAEFSEDELKAAYKKLYFTEQYVSELLSCPVMPTDEGETAEKIYEECKGMGSMIAYVYPKANMTSPMLRNHFDMPTHSDEKARVIAHINSLGYHELYVNGVKVGSDVLQPSVSRLDKRSLIVAYDITGLVTPHDNDVVIRLGKGWYRSNTYSAEHDGPVVKACIDYVMGKNVEHLLSTDDSWTVSETGYRDTGAWQPLQFGGERLEAAGEPESMEGNYLDRNFSWSNAEVIDVTRREVSPQMAPPNRIIATHRPVSITHSGNGWLIDMGKVFTGWFEMAMPQLTEGTEITIAYSDYLGKDGFEPQGGETDVFVSAGRDGERFCNKFHHHAYRYVMVTGIDEAPQPQSIRGLQIGNAYKSASSFECSDKDINAIHDMVNHTMQCLTFSGYMVDCPHLERAGYGGDGNSSTMTLQTMYDVHSVYNNWLQCWSDSMQDGGMMPNAAPSSTAGGGGGPYWNAFMAFAPWRTFINYDDKRIIETYYPRMKDWIGFVDKHTDSGGLLRRWDDPYYAGWYLGDWIAPDGVDVGGRSVDLVSNCVVSETLAYMARIAEIIGNETEARQWRDRRDNLNAAIHREFYNPQSHTYATGSQLDMCYPMLIGAVPPEIENDVMAKMLELSTVKYNGHIAGGLMGVTVVTDWAVKMMQPDFFYGMLKKRDKPGFLYMIDNGATATWEYWDGQRSHVHNCFNGIGTWFYQGLGGIIPQEGQPGYRRFTIKPQIPDGIEWVNVSKDTPYGTITVEWKVSGNELSMQLDVPAGSEAEVWLPSRSDGDKWIYPNVPVVLSAGQYVFDGGELKISSRQMRIKPLK